MQRNSHPHESRARVSHGRDRLDPAVTPASVEQSRRAVIDFVPSESGALRDPFRNESECPTRPVESDVAMSKKTVPIAAWSSQS
jgi:hypothetical protein